MKKIGQKSFRVVFLRHGQSIWNQQNRFTGWTDVKLTEKGIQEARKAGQVLKANGYNFDIAYTSILQRAIKTFNLVTQQMNLFHIPVIKTWRLNQRHYGALQGLNKKQTAQKHGEDQVLIWRRSFDIPPPELQSTDQRHPIHDPKFSDIPKGALPGTESLKTTIDRVLPYWYDQIAPKILSGKEVLVAAHGNSLRAIIKHLKKISDSGKLLVFSWALLEIVNLNIPTGVPAVYNFDKDLNWVSDEYIGDQEQIKAKIAGVKAQGKSK